MRVVNKRLVQGVSLCEKEVAVLAEDCLTLASQTYLVHLCLILHFSVFISFLTLNAKYLILIFCNHVQCLRNRNKDLLMQSHVASLSHPLPADLLQIMIICA
ncbi:hypothetical protein CHARACLAT_020401 [Characodon lateralis]|uniref:Uncharacterized protein n=1 Tax=Characodon lateralis TaxID=208331 RepID=A0ABU7CZ96_9TELE|nr:hypothetical protein [Characodon lateralis]